MTADKKTILHTYTQKSLLIQKIRRFFNRRGYLEVLTPVLTPYPASEPFIDPVVAFPLADNKEFFLVTSPEYYMKRLLKLGATAIYQINSVFRRFETGKMHKPEFIMLEWYSTKLGYKDIIKQASQLIKTVLSNRRIIKVSYQKCWIEICGIDPLMADKKLLDKKLTQKITALKTNLNLNNLSLTEKIDVCMGFLVQPKLAKNYPTVVYDFPADTFALAKINADKKTAARFEIYYKGVELCNGYAEMTDEKEINKTLHGANQLRKTMHKKVYPVDKHFLNNAKGGLPPSAGVALGLDRLLALSLHKNSLDKLDDFTAEK